MTFRIKEVDGKFMAEYFTEGLCVSPFGAFPVQSLVYPVSGVWHETIEAARLEIAQYSADLKRREPKYHPHP
jgi:hypothetical protein